MIVDDETWKTLTVIFVIDEHVEPAHRLASRIGAVVAISVRALQPATDAVAVEDVVWSALTLVGAIYVHVGSADGHTKI